MLVLITSKYTPLFQSLFTSPDFVPFDLRLCVRPAAPENSQPKFQSNWIEKARNKKKQQCACAGFHLQADWETEHKKRHTDKIISNLKHLGLLGFLRVPQAVCCAGKKWLNGVRRWSWSREHKMCSCLDRKALVFMGQNWLQNKRFPQSSVSKPIKTSTFWHKTFGALAASKPSPRTQWWMQVPTVLFKHYCLFNTNCHIMTWWSERKHESCLLILFTSFIKFNDQVFKIGTKILRFLQICYL